MPLLKIESIDSSSSWALWQISETESELEALYRHLGCGSEIPPGLKLKRKEWLAGRILVRHLLKNSGTECREVLADENGRPYLAGLSCNISISHCSEYAAAIINNSKKVGIDIELVQEKVRRVADKFLSNNELGRALNLEEMSAYWCLKEVLYKVYALKKLSLKNNIFIHPFKLKDQQGVCLGEIILDKGIEKYNLKYIRFQRHILAFNYYV